jgi:hypothetical protein
MEFRLNRNQMTYLEDILDFLTDEPQSLDDAFLSGDKTTYAIAAIKQGIKKGKIIMIEKPEVKTKYKGHLYYLNYMAD